LYAKLTVLELSAAIAGVEAEAVTAADVNCTELVAPVPAGAVHCTCVDIVVDDTGVVTVHVCPPTLTVGAPCWPVG
jgi:hypothetical protein